MNNQKWYLCNVCNTICPQLSPEHHSAECTCINNGYSSKKGSTMELLEESDPKIQSNEHYKELMKTLSWRYDRV